MVSIVTPTRQQLSMMAHGDQRLIIALQQLFDLVSVVDPDDAGVSDTSLEVFSAPFTQSNAAYDFIEFPPNAPTPSGAGILTWNDEDDTLNIQHKGGVTQQVGLETYAYLDNNSGSPLSNGDVVSFDGMPTDQHVGAEKFIADGTIAAPLLIGVMTEQVNDGEEGRATVYGVVRGLDTTGGGELWSVGDTLYASPYTLGGLTNVKPTSPNISMPIGYVLSVGAEDGAIFVRPVIQQRKLSGAFRLLATTTPALADTALSIVMDATDASVGVSLGTPASRAVVSDSGLYLVDFSAQLTSSNASSKDVWFWFRKNGVDISGSAAVATISGNGVNLPISSSVELSLAAGDYIEVYWAASSTTVSLEAIAATAFAPSSPAASLVVTQVQL